MESEARKISRAVFKVAQEIDDAENFLDRVSILARIYRDNKDFRHLMLTRRIPVDGKMDIVHQTFGATLTELEYQLLQLLFERNLGHEIPTLARSLVTYARIDGRKLDLTVFTPQPLPEDDLSSLADRMEKSLGRLLKVKGVADPSLIGGMKLRLGNTLVDGTVARRLELLREGLI